jgi:hypothetical protein
MPLTDAVRFEGDQPGPVPRHAVFPNGGRWNEIEYDMLYQKRAYYFNNEFHGMHSASSPTTLSTLPMP